MRTIIFSLLFFLFLSCILPSPAAAQKIILRGNKTGGIVVTKGKMRATINLSADVAGCAYVEAGDRKRELDAMECTASPAGFKLIDATVKNNQIYLVAQTEAMGNCNVCGQCGASVAFGIVWLELGANLRLIKKKSVPLSVCREDVSLINPKITMNDGPDNESLTLAFKGDVLTIELEKRIYSETNTESYEFSRLVYDRKTPEKGFVIKTEKRDKSSEKENDR